MLKARPKGFFSWDFVISEGAGGGAKDIAEVSLAWFRERGELLVKGERCAIYREGLAGDFCLEWGGEVVARATKTSVWRRHFALRFEGRELELAGKSIWSRVYFLSEVGLKTGSISPDGILTRKATVDLPEDVPLPVQVFMFWLVVVMWRRAANSNS